MCTPDIQPGDPRPPDGTPPTPWTDEQLVAYALGELGPGDADRLRADAQHDAPLQRRLSLLAGTVSRLAAARAVGPMPQVSAQRLAVLERLLPPAPRLREWVAGVTERIGLLVFDSLRAPGALSLGYRSTASGSARLLQFDFAGHAVSLRLEDAGDRDEAHLTGTVDPALGCVRVSAESDERELVESPVGDDGYFEIPLAPEAAVLRFHLADRTTWVIARPGASPPHA